MTDARAGTGEAGVPHDSGSTADAAAPAAEGGLALVLTGGGARAAFQTGFLAALGEHRPDLEIEILTGVSAGAINAAYLASHEGSFEERTAALETLWRDLQPEKVYDVRPFALSRKVFGWGFRLLSGGLDPRAARPRGLLDTTPVERLVASRLCEPDDPECLEGMPGIARNLARGRLRAVAITTTSYTTGQTVTWIEGRPGVRPWDRSDRVSRMCRLRIQHILASSAIPFLFPAVEIDGRWYGDGGVRLYAPLAPAVHLGADRILAMSTRYVRSLDEADAPSIDSYPPPAQVGGVLFNAVFLDLLDADAHSMERINTLLTDCGSDGDGGGDGGGGSDGDGDGEGGGGGSGGGGSDGGSGGASSDPTSGSTDPMSRASRTLRPVQLEVVRPGVDLGRLASDFEPELPRFFRFLSRGLGTRETRSNDLLSLLMFQPDYLGHLIDLGRQQFARQRDTIDALLDDR